MLSFFALFAGCDKDEINNTDTQVGISRVTFFPTLTMSGDRYVVIPVGTSYTEPGVTATESGVDIPVTISGTVNTNAAGVYTLTYSASNKDGIAASIIRTVVVYNTDASAAANDLSGRYARSTNGSVAVWTKLAPGVYSVFNPGGAPGTNLTVIVFNPTGFVIDIPQQVGSEGGVFSSQNETYNNTSPPSYSWVIINTGYGTALRTFTKI